jgi:hypothetical protein
MVGTNMGLACVCSPRLRLVGGGRPKAFEYEDQCKQLAMEVLEEPTTLSTSTCFPRLDPEIRLKIWCLTVRWHLPTPYSAIIPATLHACRKSRQEALKTYQRLSFGVWINFSVDIIYMRLFLDYNGTGVDFERKFLELL